MRVLTGLRRVLTTIAVLAAAAVPSARATGQAAAPPPTTLALPGSGQWGLETSHAGVEAAIDPPPGAKGTPPPSAGFTLKYNFTQGSGFAIARLVFPQPPDLPENYELSFDLQGTGPSNDLEVKLLDAAGNGQLMGASVWWVKRRNFEWPETTTRVNNKAKHFQFAWGPLNGAKIKRLGGVEIVVASSSGGQGQIVVSDVQLRPLPTPMPYTGRPVATASSWQDGSRPEMAIDGTQSHEWLAADNKTDGKASWWAVDFGSPRDLDAVHIEWTNWVSQFRVEVSDDGAAWRRVWEVHVRKGTADSWVDIPDTTTRHLRITVERLSHDDEPAGIDEIGFLQRPPAANGSEQLGIWPLIVESQSTGLKRSPRYFSGRQSTWTVLGAPDNGEEALINEDGVIELWHGGASLEPALQWNHGALRSADADPTRSGVSMLDGLPVAIVRRSFADVDLTITAFVSGDETASTLFARYEIVQRGNEERRVGFCWLLRPFQVNPPWQFLGLPGGLARVKAIEYKDDRLVINGSHTVALPPQTAGEPRQESGANLWVFDQSEAGLDFDAGSAAWPQDASVTDPRGAASALVRRSALLKPGGRAQWVIGVPLNSSTPPPAAHVLTPAEFDVQLAKTREQWAKRLGSTQVHLPPGNEQLAASITASLGYILVNKDGPGFQPGSRSYERSWIRDGALTSAALLEFGLTDEVRKFIDWYAAYQFPTGAIPCVVDKRGADPVTENDSHGQFIYALAEYHRYTHDDAFALKHFDEVEKAVAHIQAERSNRMSADYQSNATRAEPRKPAVPLKAFYGLMPESISHEGYSSKPMHSYWDDFFTLKGLRDATYLARVLKKDEQAKAFQAAADDMAACIKRSIELTQKAHGIGYIPGCVELGDFDATSTTIAVNPCGALDDLPRAWYDATFAKWWEFFEARRDNRIDWVDYTPYEWRIVGTLVMLGQRERAWESTRWYMQDQNPPRKPGDTGATGWLHWAEIVHKDRGAGKWIGDMPHTWVASDFLRSVRTMFLYEEPAPIKEQSSLVLFAGVPTEWADAPGGVSFTGLRTPYGPLNASLKKLDDGRYELKYSGLERTPYRVRLAPPLSWPPKQIEVLEGGGAANDKQGGLDGITTGMTIRFR